MVQIKPYLPGQFCQWGRQRGLCFKHEQPYLPQSSIWPEQGEFDSKLYQNRNEGIKPVKREHANSRKKYSGQDRARSVRAVYATEMQAVVRRWGWWFYAQPEVFGGSARLSAVIRMYAR